MNKLDKDVLDAFGKVIYAVAKADGEVQEAEVDVIRQVIDNHEWAQEIELSFEVERELDEDAEEIFDKAIAVFKFKNVQEHFGDFIDLLEKIAKAHGGIVNEEALFIQKFKNRLEQN